MHSLTCMTVYSKLSSISHFSHLRKDQCLLCESAKNDEVIEELTHKLELHKKQKELCREEKHKDIEQTVIMMSVCC